VDAILRAERISKSFGPVEVLGDVSLALAAGEVHAVIGENGAGKSTFMRILSGHLQPTSGTVYWEERPVAFANAAAAERHGIVLVHQEILLAENLTVAQNLFLGREMRLGLLADDGAMRAAARRALDALGASVAPDAEVRRLSIADRQLVQIARALLVPHRVVILDEPTAVLTPVEVDALFAVIRRLSAAGAAVLYISHRLPEVKAVSDRTTILRDGRLAATRATADLEPVDMARLMVGRDLSKLFPAKPATASDEIVFAASDVIVPGHVKAASFELRRGEILGFAGLVGAGRTELFEGLLGLRPCRGEVFVNGRQVAFRNVRAAMRAGVAYLSEDRKGKGLLLGEGLRPNLTLAALERFARGPFVDVAAEAEALDAAVRDYDIRAPRRDIAVGQLSGGNQQKLLLAKIMLPAPRIVVIDEPTRGVDIGTKEQIYRLIAGLALKGCSVVVISSDMQELIGLCHRVLVMRAGRIAGEVEGAGLTEDGIVFLATGVQEERAAQVAAGRA
jgi:ribose transport system ATP-binding protein